MPHSSSHPLRVGIVGFGTLAEGVHLPVLLRSPGVRVVAVAEPDPARLAGATRAAPDVRTSPSWEALLAADDIDAVVVASPNALHAPAAAAALRSGRHVYLEKPLALSTAEAGPLLDAWRSSGRVGMIGFNYRFNPLLARLRMLIAQGRAGEVAGVRTVFSAAPRSIPAWKRARASGGGVLLDLASHHFDLLRFLFGKEIARARASLRSIRAEDDGALVELELEDGVPVQSFFSLSAAEADRIEVIGREARLSVDRHRSVDVLVEPAALDGPVRELARAAAAVTRAGYLLEKRRAPWHEPSFPAALAHFVRAARGETKASPDLEDGLRSLRVVEAAEASARTGGWEVVHRDSALGTRHSAAVLAAHRGDSVPRSGETRAHSSSPTADPPMPGPRLSVILITPDRFDTIRRTVRHLAAQTVRDTLELIVIAPSRDRLGGEAEMGEFRWWRVIETSDIAATGPLRALAVRESRAPVVAFAEDHCFPDPGWAAALLSAHERGHAAVGPVIRNANPEGAVSWADLLMGYGPWLAPRGGEMDQLPGHNSSYKREILLEYGDRLAEMMDAETVLQWDLRSKGHTLRLEPGATAAHTNFARWRHWAPASFHHGRVFGATRAADWPATRRLAFTLASPLIPLVRFARSVRWARDAGMSTGRLAGIAPTLLAGLAIDGVGQMLGYAAGAGRSRDILGTFEFHRLDHNREPDGAEG